MYKVDFQDFSIFTKFLQTTQETLRKEHFQFEILDYKSILGIYFHYVRIVSTVLKSYIELSR